MKLLILTQYYPPETGAPQNRLHDLAKRLAEKGVDVTVLTAMPNYPQNKVFPAYKGKFFFKENIDGIQVVRSWIYVSKSRSVFSRLLNYFSFVFTSFWVGLFKLGKQDYLICESPPLFLGKTAFLLSRLKGAKLIFNVSDLWPESAEKLGLIKNKFLLGMAGWLEKFIYKRSWLITGQTQGIVENISKRFPQKKVHWLPNGIDVDSFQPEETSGKYRLLLDLTSNDFVAVYAGLHGYAQGLDVITGAAELLLQKNNIHFVLAGSGPEKERLIETKNEKQLTNVHFLDVLERADMPVLLSDVDVAIIPLKKLELFKGAVPSKAFEAIAMEKPVLLGVEGEAKKLFIDEGNAGLAFEPENAKQLADKLIELSSNSALRKKLGGNGRQYVLEKFDRQKIADNFYRLISPQVD